LLGTVVPTRLRGRTEAGGVLLVGEEGIHLLLDLLSRYVGFRDTRQLDNLAEHAVGQGGGARLGQGQQVAEFADLGIRLRARFPPLDDFLLEGLEAGDFVLEAVNLRGEPLNLGVRLRGRWGLRSRGWGRGRWGCGRLRGRRLGDLFHEAVVSFLLVG
jgi:hypothetical protein